MRWLFLLLFAPLWMPWRAIRWLRFHFGARPVLRIALSGSLPDVPLKRGVLGWVRRSAGDPHLLGLLTALDEAGRDAKLETIVVRIGDLECGLGRAEEVRAALARVKAAGKRVVVHADQLGLAGYWVALGASKVWLSPQGSLDVCGVAMEFTLLKGLLDRVGVRAQLAARGRYKSMREMFSAEAISDANREMLESLVKDLHGQLVARVAEARSLSEEAVKQELDQGPFRAEEARERGLIDATRYWDELEEELDAKAARAHHLDGYQKWLRRRSFWPRRGVRVALLRISGNIRSGHDRPGPSGTRSTGDRSLAHAIHSAVESRRVRALLLRVDSPGGSALASDLMWRELTLAAQKKPVFVSMVNVAASGGYYASGLKGVPVWANPTTLTGSIGVVGGKFEISKLLENLGVGRATVASGPRANYHSISTPWDESELAKLERDIDASYESFVRKMADARGMSFEALHEVAQGRVWTGRQAQGVALVDHLGGFHEVRGAIAERLGLARDRELQWLSPSGRSRLGARPENELESLLAAGSPLSELPELAEILERALDLGGERLFCLSPVQPRIRT